jgi:plastocyanin
MSPTSPSVASSRQTLEAQRSASPLARRGVDSDGDGYDDPDSGMPPDSGMYPEGIPPEGFPQPEGFPPAPVQLTIGIVGLFGPLSFVPNPLQAAIGNAIIWTNNDVLQHDIVLDDGTPVGNLAPGQSSAPISLTTENASFHCTLHPSMTGQITPIPIVVDGLPLPPDGSQPPMPDPSYSPSPDPYSYDDGYEDDYY